MESTLEIISRRKKDILFAASLLLATVGCYSTTKNLSVINNLVSRKEAAQENLITLLSDRGYIGRPYEEFVSNGRIKTGCYEKREGDYISFNCGLIDSMKFDCGVLEGTITLKLKNGEVCPLVAQNSYAFVNDGCDWAKKVEENLKEYCNR